MKPIQWVGSAKADLLTFPPDTVREIGHALYLAQRGGKASNTKPLKGFGGASVLEIIEDQEGDTYRAIYTVRFADVIYVLHAFQKKSKKGIATPQKKIEKIMSRLNQAKRAYRTWKNQ